MQRSGRYGVGELHDGVGDGVRAPGVIVSGRELVSARAAFLERFLAVALQHQVGSAPDIDLGYHPGKIAGLRSRNVLTPKIALVANIPCQWPHKMPPISTAEDVVRRIAAECAYVDERGGVGIRLEPAAAIVRQYGEQFRRPPRRKQARRAQKPPPVL